MSSTLRSGGGVQSCQSGHQCLELRDPELSGRPDSQPRTKSLCGVQGAPAGFGDETTKSTSPGPPAGFFFGVSTTCAVFIFFGAMLFLVMFLVLRWQSFDCHFPAAIFAAFNRPIFRDGRAGQRAQWLH